MRHLDGLDPQVLQVALTAAAIGRQFDFELLRAVTGLSEEALVDTLRSLISRQIISVNRREVGESDDLDVEGDYRFRHALTRDAIYNRLLPQERKAAHRLIAETIEKLYAGELELHWTQLAYHFWEARVWDSVLKYSALAGEKALKLNAPHSAIELLNSSIDRGPTHRW